MLSLCLLASHGSYGMLKSEISQKRFNVLAPECANAKAGTGCYGRSHAMLDSEISRACDSYLEAGREDGREDGCEGGREVCCLAGSGSDTAARTSSGPSANAVSIARCQMW